MLGVWIQCARPVQRIQHTVFVMSAGMVQYVVHQFWHGLEGNKLQERLSDE